MPRKQSPPDTAGAASGIDSLTARVARRLAEVEGVTAVALGGSRARQEASPDSDVDLGLYYRTDHPPSLAELQALAKDLDDRGAPEAVTAIGEWGPWVNGGAWLQIDGHRVDWLYRDVERVARVIIQCRAGRPTCDYQVGHPHGFHNHMYMAEAYYGRILVDPSGALASLKRLTTDYPPRLKQALIQKYLFEAEFALRISRKPANRGDVSYVVGNLFRSVACLVQVVFACNKRYFMNEKDSVRAAAAMPERPAAFGETVGAVLATPGADADELAASIQKLSELVRQTAELCGPLGELPPQSHP